MARRRARFGAARVAVACVALVVARTTRATTTASCAAMLDDDDDAPRTTYSSARRAESREVRYGTSWNASGETRAREDGVTLRLTAPPWCGSTRALALALERELASEPSGGARVLWERPWRPAREATGGAIGSWSAPRAEFELADASGTRVRYGGEWSAAGLARAARTLNRETMGKNESVMTLWPFVRLRDKYAVADFFDNGAAELAVVVLDPCKSADGCASTASMRRLRAAILERIGYTPKNRLGVLMGADAWRIGTKLLDEFDPDDITAVAFVRGALHSVWMGNRKNETSVERWIDEINNATVSTVVRRGFFSLSEFSPAVGARKLAMIFANEANEDLDALGVHIHHLVDSSSLNATVGVVDTSRGTWLLCQITDSCDDSGDDETSRIQVALIDVEEDSIQTVNVSPLPDGALSETRPFTRSARSVPKTPAGMTPPRVPHIARNQLDHKAAQTMALRRQGKFSVLFSSSACAFCQRFLSLLNAALGDLDYRALVDGTQTARAFQIDCAVNDCHDSWDAEAQSLVGRVLRYPTLVTYDGATGRIARYTGAMNARDIAEFLANDL